MTPVEMEVALHYYYKREQMRPLTVSVMNAHQTLKAAGLLELTAQGDYAPTQGLNMYVEALGAVPLPVQKWSMP